MRYTYSINIVLDVSEHDKEIVMRQVEKSIENLLDNASFITQKDEILVSINDGDDSLIAAQKYIEENIDVGCKCPACNRFIKQYKRKLTSSMAHALILLYKSGLRDYVHMAEFLKNKPCPSSIYGDVSKFRFWGILDKQEDERDDGNPNNGYYKITEKGIQFCEGLIEVPKYIEIKNNRMVSQSEELTTIQGALGNKFNYNELMDIQL